MIENFRCTNQLIEAQHHQRYKEDQEEQLSYTSQHIENYNGIVTQQNKSIFITFVKGLKNGKINL